MECKEYFLNFFPKVIQILSDYLDTITVDFVKERCIEMVKFAVKGGKCSRGMICASCFNELIGCECNSKKAEIGYILGWAMEILQGSFLVADDLMDQSQTRRGNKCWYIRDDVGDQAVNDAVILENLSYTLIQSLEDSLPFETIYDLVKVMREISTRTSMGQTYDYIGFNINFDVYNVIVTNKTSYYTIYGPIIVGMIASQKFSLDSDLSLIHSFSMKFGYFFQAQDDWIDVFGDPSVTGKIGSDIKEGKVTWIICKALELAEVVGGGIKERLIEAYGKVEKESEVYEILNFLKVSECFKEFEKEEGSAILKIVDEMPPTIPKKSIGILVSRFIGRSN